MTSDTKFAYYRPGFKSANFVVTGNNHCKGGIAVAYAVHVEETLLGCAGPVVVLEYAVSICDPRDVFVKSKGRAQAEDRLVNSDGAWSGILVLGVAGQQVPVIEISDAVIDSAQYDLFAKVADTALGHVYLNKVKRMCLNAPVEDRHSHVIGY